MASPQVLADRYFDSGCKGCEDLATAEGKIADAIHVIEFEWDDDNTADQFKAMLNKVLAVLQ